MRATIAFLVLYTVTTIKCENISPKMVIGRQQHLALKISEPIQHLAENPIARVNGIPVETETETSVEQIPDTTIAFDEAKNSEEKNQQNSGNDGEIFELTLTIEKPWLNEYKNKLSEAFAKLSTQLDMELGSLVDNEVSPEITIESGSFQLLNVLPSNIDGCLFVNIAFQLPKQVDVKKFFEVLEMAALIRSKLYEINVKVLGLQMFRVNGEDLEEFREHCDCKDLNFCRKTSEAIETTTAEPTNEEEIPAIPSTEIPDSSEEFDENCSPNDAIHRGSTSIYIFDDQTCVNQVKNGKISRNCGWEKLKNSVRGTRKAADDMDSAPSDRYEQILPPDEDETVLVVRKKGNKVFIEF